MGDYLPRYYSDSRIVGNILDRESFEFTGLNTEITSVLNQFFIDTADSDGLARWEKICGITTDVTKPLDQRASVVKSKVRGIGTVTITLIKSVADAYTNGDVDVTENNSNYEVIITFTSKLGVPPNFQDAQDSLREIIPAHLGITFRLKYLLIQDIHQVMTLNQMQSHLLTDFAPFQPL
jgi:hypothetical protein